MTNLYARGALAATVVAASLAIPSVAGAQSEMDIRLINTLNALDKRLAAIERRLDAKSKQEADDAKAEVRALKQQLGTRVAARPANGDNNAAYMADPGRGPPIIGRPNHWAGAFASISAGSQWLDGEVRSVSNSTSSQVTVTNAGGVITQTTANSVSSGFSRESGNDWGAAFTGTLGYNWMVSDRFYVGYQSEVSHVLSDTRLTGTRSFTQTQVQGTTSFAQTGTNFTESVLTNKWTASALARLGVMVTPDTQIYALAGWSWGGFTRNSENGGAIVLDGPTVGVGIERDFGWLRGFVQGKAIFYDDKTLNVPLNQTQSFSQSVPGATVTQTFSQVGNDRRKYSADAYTLMGGVVVPLDFRY
jgi:hypothetical protein